MRHLTRQVFLGLCTTISLALAVLWFRSNRVSDIVVFDAGTRKHFEITTLAAQIRVTRAEGWPTHQPPRYFRNTTPPGYPLFGHNLMRLSFGMMGTSTLSRSIEFWTAAVMPDRPPFAARVWFTTLNIPMAIPIILFGFFPAYDVLVARSRRLKRQYRLTHHLCLRCGYDLRSTPDRCPECGQVAASTL